MKTKEILLMLIVILMTVAITLGIYILVIKIYYSRKAKKENEIFNPDNMTAQGSLAKFMESRRKKSVVAKQEEEKNTVFIKNADLFKNTDNSKVDTKVTIDPFNIKKTGNKSSNNVNNNAPKKQN